jgi:hypothetical protein
MDVKQKKCSAGVEKKFKKQTMAAPVILFNSKQID